ncbi:MAG: site-specific integrase [Oscillospiraceae bacterium]|jgi:integrase|nr:site-specific integrase [Oscillospiraceae bacterium]
MASVTKRGDSYRIAVSNGYRTDGKKIVHTKTWTPLPNMTARQIEKELERVKVEYENAVKRGQAMSDNTTLAAFADKWLAEHVDKQLQETTAESYRHELKTKILPALGHMRLDAIQPMHVMAFIDQMGEDGIRIDKKPGGYSHRTVKYQYDILSSLMQSAVYWQVIQANPCERVKPPARKDAGQQKPKHFSDEQTGLFLSLIGNEPLKYQLLAYLGVYVGSRRGEVLALKWSDMDLDAGEISIEKQHAYLPGKGIFTKDTKTGGSVRAVSIPASVTALLKQHKIQQLEQRMKIGDQWEDHNLIFTTWCGRPMATATPRQWMTKFVTRHNARIAVADDLTPKEKTALTLPLISYHGLRHTSATLLITEGVDIKTASARLGHAQVSTFTDVYSHFLKSTDRAAADKLENRIEQSMKKGHA